MTPTDSARVATATQPSATSPIRPRGAARRAANASVARPVGVGYQTTGAAVPPAAAPVPTPDPTLSGAPLPRRRELRERSRSTATSGGPRRTDLRGGGLRALALRPGTTASRRKRGAPDPHVPELPHVLGPRRSVVAARTGRPAALPAARAGSTTRLLPVTASALAACLVVSGATPAAGLDDPTGLGLGAARTAAPTPARHLAPAPEQHYRVASGVTVTVTRDGFDVRQTRAGSARHGGVQITTGAGAVRPVAGTIPTAGGFGGRQVAGCGACSTNHHGLDFAAAAGTPVVAVMPGRVVSAGPLGGYGNQVLLAHPDGTQTRYGHLSRIDVLPGQSLSAGEQVGAVGSTGISTGPHLHFEVIIGGAPVDPAPWLAARGLL